MILDIFRYYLSNENLLKKLDEHSHNRRGDLDRQAYFLDDGQHDKTHFYPPLFFQDRALILDISPPALTYLFLMVVVLRAF